MKQITLKSITIKNFKGIKYLHLDFLGDVTNICGENATGKTTVFDAFAWLLFGKDSADREKFGIIPLNKNNRPLEKVDNEVSAILVEDGAEIELKRIHHQKWVKRRGSTDVEYAGNENLFYYNGVPQKASDYKKKIESILDEGIFKLVTNPLQFNSLHWQDRREILTAMAGKITNEDIENRLNGQATELLEIINKGKPIEDLRLEISAKKKKIKDDLSSIPTRIDEIQKGMPEPIDVKGIRKQIDEKQKAIDEIDQQIADVRKQNQAQDEAYSSLRDSKNKLQAQADEIHTRREKEINQEKHAVDSAISKASFRIEENSQQIESKKRQKKFEEEGLRSDQNAIEGLREDWRQENARRLIFNEEEFRCPTCGREYEAEDIEAKKTEMTTAYMNSKRHKLELIDSQGSELKSRIERTQQKIKSLDEDIRQMEGNLSEAEEYLKNQPDVKEVDVDEDLKDNKEYQDILASIKELEEKLSQERTEVDISSHQEMKRTINSVLDDLKRQLSAQDVIDRGNDRIKELSAQEKDLSQQLADLEKQEFDITQFIKARTDLIEERVNDRFSMVRFKMFDQQINKAEVETCETLINGVPFPDANDGAKINAGLDIINVLSEHYGISAPIFVDHKESISKLIATKSQLINLVVTGDKQLTIK